MPRTGAPGVLVRCIYEKTNLQTREIKSCFTMCNHNEGLVQALADSQSWISQFPSPQAYPSPWPRMPVIQKRNIAARVRSSAGSEQNTTGDPNRVQKCLLYSKGAWATPHSRNSQISFADLALGVSPEIHRSEICSRHDSRFRVQGLGRILNTQGPSRIMRLWGNDWREPIISMKLPSSESPSYCSAKTVPPGIGSARHPQ